ncbi:hypothetical protein KKG22_02735 [Patescibacteria group bacterium]|nr:hypothetical protein [Patescibacteria group bacterium]MBU1721720.1 hypothetical protein [Patescibacteria group bacterium]MBU1901874.1 hypothetical protein [Patescibacteria group bacterium]
MITFLSLFLRMYRRIVVMSVSVFIVLCTVSFVSAFGISPTPVFESNAVNDVRIARTINIVRSNNDDAVLIKIYKSGDSARYIDLPVDEFIAPAGQILTPYTFYIAPSAAANGRHTALLLFEKQGAVDELGAIINGARGLEAIGLSVGFEISDRQVLGLKVADSVFEPLELGMPLSISYLLQNTGNVDTKLDKIQIDVVDITDENHTYSRTVLKQDLEFISPGASERRFFMLDEKMPMGRYKATISYFFNQERIFSDHRTIEVLAPGTLGQSMDIISLNVPEGPVHVGTVADIISVIKNTGKVGFASRMYVDIYKDGERLDTLRAKDVFLLKDQQTEFRSDFMFNQGAGVYRLEIYFTYGAQKTAVSEFSIQVINSHSSFSLLTWFKSNIIITNMPLCIFLIILLMLMTICCFLKNRKQKKEKEYQQQMPPVAYAVPQGVPQQQQEYVAPVVPQQMPVQAQQGSQTMYPPVFVPQQQQQQQQQQGVTSMQSMMPPEVPIMTPPQMPQVQPTPPQQYKSGNPASFVSEEKDDWTDNGTY